nr:MAG TPA: hypothetical protein [Caudoviricetes sp.]
MSIGIALLSQILQICITYCSHFLDILLLVQSKE